MMIVEITVEQAEAVANFIEDELIPVIHADEDFDNFLFVENLIAVRRACLEAVKHENG